MFYERNILEVLRMFYERNILEDPTKWNFHDSPRIEQSLLEKTSTSLVCSTFDKHVDMAIKYVTSTPLGLHRPGSSPSFLYSGPVAAPACWLALVPDRASTAGIPITVCVSLFCVIDTVQQGPGGKPGDCLSPRHPNSDAGCADLPWDI